MASVIFDAIHDKVATKADVQASEAALKSELQALRHDVQGSGAATRADIAAGTAENRVCRIGGDNLAGDQPVEQHADRCQMLLDRRPLETLSKQFRATAVKIS